MELENRSITKENLDEACKKAFDISFEKANNVLEVERIKATEYLKKALELD